MLGCSDIDESKSFPNRRLRENTLAKTICKEAKIVKMVFAVYLQPDPITGSEPYFWRRDQMTKNTPLLGKTTIVTRVRNRNAILWDTLKNWLQFDVPEIIVTDYRDDGSESAWNVVKGLNDSRIKVIETKYEYMFAPTLAWNLGISQVKTEYILCLDVDDVLATTFFEQNVFGEKKFICGWGFGSLTGAYYIKKEHHDSVNGFNEEMLYMGYGDIDLYMRLKAAGFSYYSFARNTIRHKDHPVRLKVVNQVQQKDDRVTGNNAYQLWWAFHECNVKISKLLPWTPESSRVQWKLTELDACRFLAERDVIRKPL